MHKSALESAFNNILFLVSGNSSSSESDGSFDAEEFQRAVQDLSFELLGKIFFFKNAKSHKIPKYAHLR